MTLLELCAAIELIAELHRWGLSGFQNDSDLGLSSIMEGSGRSAATIQKGAHTSTLFNILFKQLLAHIFQVPGSVLVAHVSGFSEVGQGLVLFPGE